MPTNTVQPSNISVLREQALNSLSPALMRAFAAGCSMSEVQRITRMNYHDARAARLRGDMIKTDPTA